MTRRAILQITSNPSFPTVKIDYASSFLDKFLGLMFRKKLEEDEGLLLAESSESRLNTAIHMFFMNFDIAVVWLDSEMRVVDKVLAKRWRPYYGSRLPARFTLELHPNQFNLIQIGDRMILSFEH